ncbi:unnamed protein product [Rhizophagus irregularis]|nr:unnamed protein product [Rhizophagus irregularis]
MRNKYNPDVFYNHDSDYEFMYEKLAVIQQNLIWIEFIGNILLDSQDLFHQNLNSEVSSVPSTSQNPSNVRPTHTPYFVYWNGINLIYCKIDWNEHFILRCDEQWN